MAFIYKDTQDNLVILRPTVKASLRGILLTLRYLKHDEIDIHYLCGLLYASSKQ